MLTFWSISCLKHIKKTLNKTTCIYLEQLISKLEIRNHASIFDACFILLKFVLPHAELEVFSLVCLLASSSFSWYLQGRLEFNNFLVAFHTFFSLRCLPMWSNSVAGESVFGNLLLNTSGYWESTKDKASTWRVNMLLGGQEIWQLLQKLDLMVHTNNLSVLVNVNSFPQSGCFCFVWAA